MCIIICEIDCQSSRLMLPVSPYHHPVSLMHETGCSGLEHWDDPEGWDGEAGERGFRMGNTCTPRADSCECMAKTTTIL